MQEEGKAFTCPRASAAQHRSSPSTTNGFIFHRGAKNAQLRHFITVAHGGTEAVTPRLDGQTSRTTVASCPDLLRLIVVSVRAACAM